MRTAIFAALAIVTFGGFASADVGLRGTYEVVGVEEDDMLKMRTGPETDYKIILGLPNGTIVRLHDCDQTGSTRWCKVSLKQTRSLKGYVSWAYLKKI